MRSTRLPTLLVLTRVVLSMLALAQLGGVLSAVSLPSEARADIECHCPPGMDHGACPMHHSTDGRERCRLRSAQAAGSAIPALFTPFTPQAPVVAVRPVVTSTPVPSMRAAAVTHHAAPDSPPPRS
jgi:hypothetical protein